MGLPRPPGLPGFSALKSWFVKSLNSRLGKVDQAGQTASHQSTRLFTSTVRPSPSISNQLRPQTLRPLQVQRPQSRGFHNFHVPKFNKPPPNFPRFKFHLSASSLRPQVGVFPRSPWGSSLGGTTGFHTSPASTAVAINQIAHSVSTALRTGLHPQQTNPCINGQIVAQVAARAACQLKDGPAGYIRFTLSPPAWTPTDTDLSDPDILSAIDTQISELQNVKKAIIKLKQYGDFPVRTVLPHPREEARIDVLFRGATAEDVARWNKNEFKLNNGRVGADQVFCAGRFEEDVRWSEVLDVEGKVDREMERGNNQDGGLLKFWEELNLMEGRIR